MSRRFRDRLALRAARKMSASPACSTAVSSADEGNAMAEPTIAANVDGRSRGAIKGFHVTAGPTPREVRSRIAPLAGSNGLPCTSATQTTADPRIASCRAAPASHADPASLPPSTNVQRGLRCWARPTCLHPRRRMASASPGNRCRRVSGGLAIVSAADFIRPRGSPGDVSEVARPVSGVHLVLFVSCWRSCELDSANGGGLAISIPFAIRRRILLRSQRVCAGCLPIGD